MRAALGFGHDNFVLAGHYWGGILAIEYALRYQENLKGLVVSNMMSSAAAYNQYVADVLLPAMEPEAQERMADFMDGDRVVGPLYDELMITNLYTRHVLRRPMSEWPSGVLSAWGSVNPAVFLRLAGPTQLGFSGALADWDRSRDLGEITVPALVIGATHDTQDPAHLSGWPSRCRRAATCTAPTGRTSRTSTTTRCTSRACWSSCTAWTGQSQLPTLIGSGPLEHPLTIRPVRRRRRYGVAFSRACTARPRGRAVFTGYAFGAEGETFGEAVFSPA